MMFLRTPMAAFTLAGFLWAFTPLHPMSGMVNLVFALGVFTAVCRIVVAGGLAFGEDTETRLRLNVAASILHLVMVFFAVAASALALDIILIRGIKEPEAHLDTATRVSCNYRGARGFSGKLDVRDGKVCIEKLTPSGVGKMIIPLTSMPENTPIGATFELQWLSYGSYLFGPDAYFSIKKFHGPQEAPKTQPPAP